MSRASRATRPVAALGLSAVVAGATTWAATLSWQGFTAEPGRFLGPLAVLAVLVAGIGTALRWRRVPAGWVVLAQVLLTGLVAAWLLTGRLVPLGEGWTALRQVFEDAAATATRYAAPVPADAPGVHPYFVLGGLGCLLLVDALATTLRRAPLAGLPLLAVYTVPVGMLGSDLPWWAFVVPAAGFLALLVLDQGDRVRGWGHSLVDAPGGSHGPASSARRTPSVGARAGATGIGASVLVLAVLLPLLIPTLSVQLFDGAGSGGGDGDVTVDNPSTDLRRDLVRPQDVPLVQVVTDDPDPSYLRVAALNRFTSNAFSPGDRDIPSTQRADGALPALVGVSSAVPRTSYSYDLEATGAFDSRWLPTPPLATSVVATGDWRYDESTRDVIASGDDLTTEDLAWSVEADELELAATDLADSRPTAGLVASELTELPEDLAPVVARLTEEVTAAAPTRFEKAVALQDWFRETGDFTYSLDVDLGTGTDDLARFLTPGDGGRVGYCEQFASAMTVMARQLGIPARVAVGFLRPTEVEPGTWVFSSHDLHAWPELFFPGFGWVRFEPTPPTRAIGVPGYTTQGVAPDDPAALPEAESAAPQPSPGQEQAAPDVLPEDAADQDATGGRRSWTAALLTLVGVGLLAALVALPGVVRRRRREQRRHGDVEDAWAELDDTARDLGVDWPAHRSPRETAGSLTPHLDDPEAVTALARIVERLERHRFAGGGRHGRTDGDSAELRRDLDRCLRTLEQSSTPARRRRAGLVPSSVLTRRARPATAFQASDATDRVSEPV